MSAYPQVTKGILMLSEIGDGARIRDLGRKPIVLRI
jgi:hypothetical protein